MMPSAASAASTSDWRSGSSSAAAPTLTISRIGTAVLAPTSETWTSEAARMSRHRAVPIQKPGLAYMREVAASSASDSVM